MSRFYQNAGPFGPVNKGPYGFKFSPAANPYVNLVAGIHVDSVGRRINPIGGVFPARTASATIAGRPHVGCCAECAADYRRTT
jgi:hypothetical protein